MTDSEKIDKLMVDVASLSTSLDFIKQQILAMSHFEARISGLEDFKNDSKTKWNLFFGGIITSVITALWNIISFFHP